MSKTLYRINDIAVVQKQYNPSINYYCKIVGIIDECGIVHTEYEVVTGCGDKNSKVKIIANIFAEEDNNQNIKELSKSNTITINPHDIYLRNPYKMIEETYNKIERLNNRVEFFNKHKNPIDVREEKLSKIIK